MILTIPVPTTAKVAINFVMAGSAKSRSVRKLISEFGVVSPGLDMVDYYLCALQNFRTVLASHVVSRHAQEAPLVVDKIVAPFFISQVLFRITSLRNLLDRRIGFVGTRGRAIFFPIELIRELVKDLHTPYAILKCPSFGHQLEYSISL